MFMDSIRMAVEANAQAMRKLESSFAEVETKLLKSLSPELKALILSAAGDLEKEMDGIKIFTEAGAACAVDQDRFLFFQNHIPPGSGLGNEEVGDAQALMYRCLNEVATSAQVSSMTGGLLNPRAHTLLADLLTQYGFKVSSSLMIEGEERWRRMLVAFGSWGEVGTVFIRCGDPKSNIGVGVRDLLDRRKPHG